MGLLDDAIREHLELKRRRGADPGEVAREQREALDPVIQEPSAASDEAPPASDQVPVDAVDDSAVALTPSVDPPDSAVAEPNADLANAGETAELDMSSVLGAEEGAPETAEESLEWEIPTGTSSAAGAHDPVDPEGAGAHGDGDERAEDVLQETPDFLRDTPEQERLWFEQRPPRDFDFDK